MSRIPILIPALAIQYAAIAQSWQTMPDVPVELAFPLVVELQGNIHVMGGGGPTGATDIHLRYTPATNTWDTLAIVPYRAQQPCGAVVDGKIHYCAGGYPNTGTPLDDHYYYDPALDQWFAAADLPFPTAINEAVALDGKLWVLSGQPDKTLCQSYDPSTDAWTAHDPLPDMSFWYGAIVATTTTIHRFGGGGYLTPVDLSHHYDPVNDAWIPQTDFPCTVHAPAGAAINDSLICIAGGYTNWNESDTVWLYDVNSQQYFLSDPLPTPRDYHALVVAGGSLYSVGGNSLSDPTAGVSLIRDPSPSFTAIPSPGTGPQRPYEVIITPLSLQIQLGPSVRSERVTIALADASGKVVLRKDDVRGGDPITLSNAHLKAGLYVLILTIGSHSYQEEWMVVP